METQNKKRMLSMVQPSGHLTLGNYLGAIRNWTTLQDEYDCVFALADLHAITVRQKPADLRRNTYEVLAQYIAAGLDPEKSVLFIQSHVPAHAQLAWVLNCYTMFGELSLMTQFKDKSRSHADNINAGLFDYPVLMAADILLYQPDYVPVGVDQLQHIEICRDIAQRFNAAYSETYTIPEPYLGKIGGKVMSLSEPTKKMSKSDNNDKGCVYLLDDPKKARKKIMGAVTDNEAHVHYDPDYQPGISNLMQIMSSLENDRPFGEIEAQFEGKGYGDFKRAVADDVCALLENIQYNDIISSDILETTLRDGAAKANVIANKKLDQVQRAIGMEIIDK